MCSSPGVFADGRLCGMNEIELADAVSALRDSLLDAVGKAGSTEVSFVVGPIEMEFAVEVRSDAKVKGGIKAWLISADAEAGISRNRVQRVKVSLSPKTASGADSLVSSAGPHAFDAGSSETHVGR